MAKLLSEKDSETASLRSLVSQLEQRVRCGSDAVEERVREELSKRDNELRLAIVKCEEEVAAVMARRERQILDAVKTREEEMFDSWKMREEEIKSDMLETVREREAWIESRTEELKMKADALDGIRKELEVKLKTMDDSSRARKRLSSLVHLFLFGLGYSLFQYLRTQTKVAGGGSSQHPFASQSYGLPRYRETITHFKPACVFDSI
jgi:hypothetical protein